MTVVVAGAVALPIVLVTGAAGSRRVSHAEWISRPLRERLGAALAAPVGPQL